jgi:hypothetical protein
MVNAREASTQQVSRALALTCTFCPATAPADREG